MNIKVVEMGKGKATLRMPFQEQLTNPYGMMHGSAAYALADSAVAVAISTLVEKGKQFFTIEMKVNYLEPVTTGIVEARAKVLRQGRIVPGEVDVYNENKLVAKAKRINTTKRTGYYRIDVYCNQDLIATLNARVFRKEV